MKKYRLSAAALLLVTGTALAQPPQGNPADMFMKQFDTDGNGGVSLQEFLKPQEVQFQHMDKDGNGEISKAEAEDFIKQMREHMMKMQKNAPSQ